MQQNQSLQQVSVLCCVCGIPILANATNTCASCLASVADITKGIATEVTLHQCRGCQRFHKESSKWISCNLESRELMGLCLNHISGLKSKRLINAIWIWTEPHSMRLKIRLTVQQQVQEGAILQQSFNVEFIVRNQQCSECQADFRQGSWKSLVQVRQRVSHKRTFLYLEQLILKHEAHRGCLSIEVFKDGMDFYWPDKSKANRFISFLESVVPTKIKTSKKLIGTDDKSNISNFKYTNLIEICPLCKDDLLFLPVKLARQLGSIAQLVMVKNISSVIHLLDPLTGQTATMTPEQFWRQPIVPLLVAARSRLTKYVVLDKEAVFLRQNVAQRATSRKLKSRLANVTMARMDDLGSNDKQLEEVSHIGYLLKAGDVVLGYNLREAQFVNDDAEQLRQGKRFPDVVLVRKLYGYAEETQATPKRIWKLQRLDVVETEPSGRHAQQAAEAAAMDEEDFMQEVEADKEMRGNMNLYKSDALIKKQSDGDAEMEQDEDDQQLQLDELLDNLNLDAGPDTEEVWEEGAKATRDGLSYVDREDARHVKKKDAAVPVTRLGEKFQTS